MYNRFQFDKQYVYMGKRVVYAGENIFPTFRYVEDDSYFYLEVGQLGLIEDAKEEVEVTPVAQDVVEEHIPVLPKPGRGSRTVA